jgi:hypothetical protein
MPTYHVPNWAALAGVENRAANVSYITDDSGREWRWSGSAWQEVNPLRRMPVKAVPPPAEEVSPQAAPAPGTAVAGTTTIDALFTTMFATRSGDLGAATYVWATPTAIIGTFPAGTTPTAVNGSRMYCRFEAGAPYPSSIRP